MPSNLQSDIEIKELTIIPIPTFFAWIKVESRLVDFKERYDLREKER